MSLLLMVWISATGMLVVDVAVTAPRSPLAPSVAVYDTE